MTETELKPCPFCGGKAHYYYQKGNESIVCEECGAKLTYFDFGDANDELVKQWNARPIEDAKDKEIKRLREALESIKEMANYMSASETTIYDSIGIYNICCDALEGEKE